MIVNIVIIKPRALAPLTPPATCAVLLDSSLVPELSELFPTTNKHTAIILINNCMGFYVPANLSPACPGLDHTLCSTGKP